MITHFVSALSIFLFLTTPLSPFQVQPSAAIVALRAARPGVKWDDRSAVKADITGDGIADTVVVGYDHQTIWVAVVPGTNSGKLAKPVIQQFSIGQTQSSFCQSPVHIEIHPLDCTDNADRPLPGCKETKGASGFTVEDGACDAFNFYWNAGQKALGWWRN